MSAPRRAVSVLSLIVLCASLSMAQTATGTISGYVEDGTGARVPGAKIAILHSATQQEPGGLHQ